MSETVATRAQLLDALTPETDRFFSHLHREGHFAHLWTDRGLRSYWFSTNGDQDEFPLTLPPDWQTANLYFTINPLAGVPPHNKQGNTDPHHIGSQTEYISAVNAFFAEYDGKDYVMEDEYAPELPENFDELSTVEQKKAIKAARETVFYRYPAIYKQRALAAIDALDLQPSIIIDSGGGYHCYWLLRDTVPIDDTNREDVQQIQRAFVLMVGGDTGASDLRRILRVPGTYNCKPGFGADKPRVEFVRADFDVLFDFHEIAEQVLDWMHERGQIEVDGQPAEHQGEMGDVRATFNRENNIADLLAAHGYMMCSKSNSEIVRMSRPDRDAHQPSVTIFPPNGSYPHEISVHWSSNDPLFSERKGRDAFDVWAHLEHSGDFKQAWIQAKKDQGKWIEHESVSVDEVLERIRAIGEGGEGTAAQIGQVREELASPIGALDSAMHVEVELALVEYLALSKTDAKGFTRRCRADAKERRKQLVKELRTAALLQRQTERGDLPAIQVNDRQLRDVAADALDAVAQRNSTTPAEPVLFVRGGALTRIALDEYNTAATQIVDEGALSGILSHVADWVEVQDDGQGHTREKSVWPPVRVARTVLTLGEWPNLPALLATVYCPTLAPDGTLHEAAGYNPQTLTYYANRVDLGDTEPTPENVTKAKELLFDDLLGDFPFKDEASRAHAGALLLLPVVRPAIRGQTPLHLIDAPSPGSGKGLLTDVCAIPATGQAIPSMAAGRDDDEWRKRLTATLLAGGTHVSIDNITEPLDSGVLASFLTQEFIEDRVLGSSRTVRLRVQNIWCANGNNVVPSDEIARRSIWIRLDANAEKPWERTGFKHPNLKRWALENRPQLLTAAVTLVRAWVDAGMPKFSGQDKGSYASWAQVMGGILETIGVPGFLANEHELFETSVSDNEAWTAFVQAWLEKYGEVETESAELFKLASYSDGDGLPTEYQNLLAEQLGAGKEQSRRIKLGKALKEQKDKVIAGRKIIRCSGTKGSPRWQLQRIWPQKGVESVESVESGSTHNTREKDIFFTYIKDKKNNSTNTAQGARHSTPSTLSTQPLPDAAARFHAILDPYAFDTAMNAARESEEPALKLAAQRLEKFLRGELDDLAAFRSALWEIDSSLPYRIDWRKLE